MVSEQPVAAAMLSRARSLAGGGSLVPRGCCREGAGVGVAGDMHRQPKPGVVMSETV